VRQDFTRVADKIDQQVILFRRQMHFQSLHHYAAIFEIETESHPHQERECLPYRSLRLSSFKSPGCGASNSSIERLGYVIVGPGVQRLDLGCFFSRVLKER